MKRFILAAAIAALASVSAFAADNLPTKAQTGYATYPVACGLYYGVNTMGETSSVSNTCPVGASGGFWFVDGMFEFANLNGSPTLQPKGKSK